MIFWVFLLLACSGKIERVLKQQSSRYLVVEVLSDDILHFEVSETRNPPDLNRKLYHTQVFLFNALMVDGEHYDENYNGPSQFSINSDGFSTATLDITIDVSLSIIVYDKMLQIILTKLSYVDLTATLKSLCWTREKTEAVYGVASAFSADGIES